jgi:hypothetical protein
LYPFAIPGCLWIVSPELEKVAAAFLVVICGKTGQQIHIFATLPHILAQNWRFAMILSRIDSLFPLA